MNEYQKAINRWACYLLLGSILAVLFWAAGSYVENDFDFLSKSKTARFLLIPFFLAGAWTGYCFPPESLKRKDRF